MAYDEKLAARIRAHFRGKRGMSEKEMFGGLTFLRDGKMLCGIVKERLMVRVGKERNDEALARPHASAMDFTHKPMAGFVYVDPPGFRTEEQLATWLAMATPSGAKAAKRRPAPKAATRR